ncbi:MAG: hypothetical protein AB1679_23775 [Actinomycetota bacterium]|jgi:uncharacterized coiled-coil protein SlyX
MDESYEQGHQLRALAMRVAALEDNVAFLEEWCEEQQDALDRAVGPVAYDYETGAEPPRRTVLRVVDLRDLAESEDEDGSDPDTGTIIALVETDHDRKVRQLRSQLNRLRTRLAATLAPSSEEPPVERRREPRSNPGPNLSAKPAGRTAP